MANQIVWLHHGGKVIRRNIRLVLTDTGRSSWIVREIGLRFTPRLRIPGYGFMEVAKGIIPLVFFLLISVSSVDAADWFLVGKEGECAPLSILEKKGAEFRGLESPYQLAEKMRAAGYKAEIKEHKAASRPSVEVRVPDRQLYVMFMKADVCNKNGPSKR